MKLPIDKVTLILVILVLESQCGVIDDIFGKVKNTTKALGQDVKNVWSYSKHVVGLEKVTEDNRPEEEKRGLIGGVLHSTREKIHHVRNYFWNTDIDAHDAGIFGNMYNRVRNRLSKVKGAILGGENPSPPRSPSENEKLIQKTLNKLFFGNGTRKAHGRAFQEAIDNLRKKLHEIRLNITGTTENPEHHGEGLIDVRFAGLDIKDTVKDNNVGVDNNVYDAVNDDLNKVKDLTSKLNSKIKEDSDKAVSTVKNDINTAVSGLNEIKDKTADATAKENELIGNNFNKLNNNAKDFKNKVTDAVEDAKRLTY